MIRRKRRVIITAEAMETLLYHHRNIGLQATLHATHAELTWAGRVFVAPLAAVDSPCRPCRGTGRRLHGMAVCPRDCDDCGGTGRVPLAAVEGETS